MNVLIFCGALIAAYYVFRRYQRGAYMLSILMDAPPPVRSAAKRLGFRSQPNVHSIVSVNSPELCVAAMATAFAQMDESTADAGATIIASIQKHFQINADTARDMATMSAWLVEEGGGPTPAFDRLTKRLKQLDHGPYFGKMMNVIGDVKASGTKGMASAQQADAMGALARIFRTA